MCALDRLFRRTETCWSCRGSGIRWRAFNRRAVRERCAVCGGTGARHGLRRG